MPNCKQLKSSKSLQEAEAAAREILAAAEKESEHLVAPVKQRTAEEVETLVNAARSKQEEAVKLVMERIVNIHGHS